MKNENETGAERMQGVPHHDSIVSSSPFLGESNHDTSEPDALEEAELDHGGDYASFTKKELLVAIQELSHQTDLKKADHTLREIKIVYDEIFEREKADALIRYKGPDGVADGFDYKGDELDQMFEHSFKLQRERRNHFYKSLEEQKGANLQRKLELLDQLRSLVDSEDSSQSFQQFKQLQQEWKSIGQVPLSQGKTLWANYTALVDRFYDHRSISFELKELDRKKNLVAKLELCEKAERLLTVEKIKDAIRELNDLHSDFKHLGPVPKEDQEALWLRFKAASDGLYLRRDSYLTDLQITLQKNLDEKLTLIETLAGFAAFQTDRIKDWNQKTQEILVVQKKWEGIGAIPRAKTKEVNRKFWQAFKMFFNSKNSFFKKLDDERARNVGLKTDIIKKAQEFQDSSDWDKTANDLKELQRQWKEVGPVPEKLREKLFQDFKQACDRFFEHRRAQFEQADREQEDNLREKEAICTELEKLTAEKTGTLEKLAELQLKFNSFGFVPKGAISAIKVRFNDAVQKLVSSIDAPTEQKDRVMLEVQLGNLRNDPQADRKIHQREMTIRKRINTIENDIAVLRNNLEFFGRSKNAEKFKEEFNAKIVEATVHLTQLRSQLKMLRSVAG